MKTKNQKKLKELFRINKVITLLKFKSAVLLIAGAIERADSIAKSHCNRMRFRNRMRFFIALSRLRLQLETF